MQVLKKVLFGALISRIEPQPAHLKACENEQEVQDIPFVVTSSFFHLKLARGSALFGIFDLGM